METIRIYGEAQLRRTVDNDGLNIIVYYGDDQKSESILKHLKTISSKDDVIGVRVALISEGRLPKEYYVRRGLTATPSVAYYYRGQEQGRTTGHHTREMLVSAIKRHLAKLK